MYERDTECVSFRTKPRIKEAIQKAAALLGVDDSIFIMNSAYRAAMKTIAAHEHTSLAAVDRAAFFATLDRPASPTDELRAAFARHRDTIDSK